jgi:hypothetical protein
MGFRQFEFNIWMAGMTDNKPEAANDDKPQPRPLSPAAQRALAEAEARRRQQEPQNMPAEVGGRGGADPARYGDWEINGRAIDF